MLKPVIFATGVVSGALALPAVLIYVKPVRTKIVDVVLNKAKNHFAEKLVDDAEFRNELIDVGTEVLAGLVVLDEVKKAEGK